MTSVDGVAGSCPVERAAAADSKTALVVAIECVGATLDTGVEFSLKASELNTFLSGTSSGAVGVRPPYGEVYGETLIFEAFESANTGAGGFAPSRPIMDGSRWWSWGIALNRCVISRAPRTTAATAMSLVATLSSAGERGGHWKKFTSDRNGSCKEIILAYVPVQTPHREMSVPEWRP